MTVITHARRPSQLFRLINAPGGISVGVALTQARANIETRRAEAMAAVDTQIAILEALAPPADLAEATSRLAEAYRGAAAVIDAAGPFDLKELCQAAEGLCDLIDAAAPNQPYDWRLVTVHAQSLRLLRTLPAEEAAARTRIMEDLGKVVSRKIAQIG